VVAAHPGAGKTAYASQVARANARSRRPVKVFSIEMSAEQLLRRALATESGVRALRLRNPKLMNEDDVKKVHAAAQVIIEGKLPLLIDDSSTLTLTELLARCRMAAKHDKAKLIIVDHAALVEAPGDNPAQQMTAVGCALRAFSKREGIPTMLLTHLNTPENHDTNAEPTMFDLKYAKDLARDAHVVLLLHRPERDGRPTGDDNIIIAKMREGQRGSIKVRFDERRMEFVERHT
jgi:replicative DNA helicase